MSSLPGLTWQSTRGDGLLRLAAQFDSRRTSMDHRVKPGGDDEQIREELGNCAYQRNKPEGLQRAQQPRRY
jgi:hypothetical protein